MSKILDWNDYLATARQAVAEGIVLVENRNQVLPFKRGMRIAVFGRIQTHYYKSGTGSGGMVNVSHVTDIMEGLAESGIVTLHEGLREIYQEWEKEHPFNAGMGWGTEPWSQEEMPVSGKLAAAVSAEADAALVIIGRTAGEDQDSLDAEGAYRLTDIEMEMLLNVRRHFSKMVVLLNTAAIIDMRFVDEAKPDAVLCGWVGGMVGGLGTADILCGKCSPSGKLTDTIAYEISDYSSAANFGDPVSNKYCEDIYVGYRYFETFMPEKVRYPFGYGLSYTEFAFETEDFTWNDRLREAEVIVRVQNTGSYSGKEVVQIYVQAPQGKLGKPARVLAGFSKTKELQPGERDSLSVKIPFSAFASYDDSGITGHAFCFLLEAGEYQFFLGGSVREAEPFIKVDVDEIILEQLEQALAPKESFKRLKPDRDMQPYYEDAPVAAALTEEKGFEQEIPYTGHVGILLQDTIDAPELLRDFVAQLSDEELASIVRGEGMGSSLVSPGTASAFGGVSKSLRSLGIPAVCCADGPSGMRLDCGTKAFSLPSGTMLACTFNRELNEKLFSFLGLEMRVNHVECILGPGMNIHRHPLNGRNFEYFSEDPLVTGEISSAQMRGLKQSGVSGIAKHFCGNNQEYNRRVIDSVISERALREIYLKGFEIPVRRGVCDSLMTTYGKVNGCYTAGSYDLVTTILRKQWGFQGIVVTDWWADITERADGQPDKTDFAAMVRAQNDLYMVCPDGETNASGDNTLQALANGTLSRGQLQRCAMNICAFAVNTQAMKRYLEKEEKVEIIGLEKAANENALEDIEYRLLDQEDLISLQDPVSDMGADYVFAYDVKSKGIYTVTLRGSSNLGELAQLPCTLFYNGYPILTMTFHGTGGEIMSISKEIKLTSRFTVMRLHVAAQGLRLADIRFCCTGRDVRAEGTE